MAAIPSGPVVLVFGEDDFGVKQRAKEIYERWFADLGGMDHEIIDAAVGNSGDAEKALSKLREALQTLPFFGGGKAVWLQNCNFLGDDRTAASQSVTENLGQLAQELKNFQWTNVRLLISAGKVDKRKVFYKALEKLGEVESFGGWSEKDWADQAQMFARRQLKDLKKDIAEDALSELVVNVGPNPRQLASEVEKLALYVGDRGEINLDDVSAIVTRNKQARAFALGDALGDRDLPRALRCLDEELWEAKFDSSKSEIGMLYGLISKFRVLICLKELITGGYIKAGPGYVDFSKFKGQLERIPAEILPEDKRFNPLSMNPYILYKALPQASKYTRDELVRAMEVLLESNRQLISGGDEVITLQQAIVKIMGTPAAAGVRR